MAPALEDGPKVEDGPCHRKWSGGGFMGSFGHRKWCGGGPMGSFGRWALPASAAFLEGTGLGGLVASSWPLRWVSPLLLWAAVVVSGLALSSPCHLLAYWWGQWWRLGTRDFRSWRLRDFLCRTWGPRCLGGRLWSVRGSGWDGGWLHRGGAAGGVGLWAGAAVSVVGGALLGSCGAWTWRTAVLGFELLALVLGPKETGGPVGALGTAAAWKLGGGVGVVVWKRKWRAGGDVGENRWLLGEGEHRCLEWWVLDWHREGVGWEVGDWEVAWGEHGWSGLGQGGQLGRCERPRKDWALGFGGLGCWLGCWQPPSHCPWLQRAASKTVVVLATKLVVDAMSGVFGFN